MKDSELSEVLGISTNTIRLWKQSNDYRFILYKYLTEPSRDKMEDWLKSFEDREFIAFVEESSFYRTFMAQGCSKLSELQSCMHIEHGPKVQYKNVKGAPVTVGKGRTFIAKQADDAPDILIIFTKRFPNLTQLEGIIRGLEIEIGHKTDKYDKILFVTNEKKCPPKYFSDPEIDKSDIDKMKKYNDVEAIKSTIEIQCLDIHTVGKTLFGKKVIFKEKKEES